MVLRATFVVLCIVLSLALFSNSSEQENGWIWAAAVGVVVAGIVLGIEYTLRQAKPGVLLGGAAGLACGLLLASLAAWALLTTVPDFEAVPVLGFLLLAIFPYLGLIYGVKIFAAAGFFVQSRTFAAGSKASMCNKNMNASVISNDMKLSKVAELQGVRMMNINELCNALKPVVLPGEQLRVFVLKEGKEAGQGVAYLDDGTMIVVDNAKRFIGSTVNVVVTSVLQTQAGRMIFARLKEETEGQEVPVARS